jgi:hypothetical protein
MASIRCDFIMNLDPFMRREAGKGVGATAGEDERGAPSLLPHPSSVTKVHLSRRRIEEGDDRSSGSSVNDGVGAPGADRGKGGGGPPVIGGRAGGGGRRLITREDDPTIRTYPLRVIDQLRLCERKAARGDDRGGIAATVGFECVHCRRISAGGARQEQFRRFPRTPKEVSIELSSFRTHLSTCRGVPHDLRSYLSWMEGRWWPSQRLQRSAQAIATHIMRRLDACRDEDRNAATFKIDESKRDDKTKKRARELEELERTKLERMKRINVKRRHSVLEDVGSLA